VAYGVAKEANMVETIRACEDASVDIHVVPRFFELGVSPEGKEVDEVWGMPLVRLRRSPWRRFSWSLKRLTDLSVAGVAILLLSPLYVLLALAVKLSSPGPVLFSQKRVGRNGKVVIVHKFRTMKIHQGSDTEWSADDSQLTRLGRLMRPLSLDELPQLFNVLRGDMSLVGPRPERPFFVERFRKDVAHYDARHRVPVGITGLAQVNGLRGDTSIEERARFDNRYIEGWSFWRDVVILVHTFFAVFRQAAFAHRPPHQVDAPVTDEDRTVLPETSVASKRIGKAEDGDSNGTVGTVEESQRHRVASAG
jgi:exopolysaccharide biosynthesis polyprenyl glycosylphosphotransferase